MDEVRIVGLTPEALKALRDLIMRSRTRLGKSPLVYRKDWHENTGQLFNFSLDLSWFGEPGLPSPGLLKTLG